MATPLKEYKIVVYTEGLFSSLLFGDAKLDPEGYTAFINDYAAQGWRVVTLEREKRRLLLFWNREAFVTLLERDRG